MSDRINWDLMQEIAREVFVAPLPPADPTPRGGTTSDLIERRARFVYDAARLAALAALAPIIPELWSEREEPFRAQFRRVIERQCGAQRCDSPSTLHAEWVDAYRGMGWTWGPVRDVISKTHPDMVPYEALGRLERDKDAVFVALCEIARQWVYDLEAPDAAR